MVPSGRGVGAGVGELLGAGIGGSVGSDPSAKGVGMGGGAVSGGGVVAGGVGLVVACEPIAGVGTGVGEFCGVGNWLLWAKALTASAPVKRANPAVAFIRNICFCFGSN